MELDLSYTVPPVGNRFFQTGDVDLTVEVSYPAQKSDADFANNSYQYVTIAFLQTAFELRPPGNAPSVVASASTRVGNVLTGSAEVYSAAVGRLLQTSGSAQGFTNAISSIAALSRTSRSILVYKICDGYA